MPIEERYVRISRLPSKTDFLKLRRMYRCGEPVTYCPKHFQQFHTLCGRFLFTRKLTWRDGQVLCKNIGGEGAGAGREGGRKGGGATVSFWKDVHSSNFHFLKFFHSGVYYYMQKVDLPFYAHSVQYYNIHTTSRCVFRKKNGTTAMLLWMDIKNIVPLPALSLGGRLYEPKDVDEFVALKAKLVEREARERRIRDRVARSPDGWIAKLGPKTVDDNR